MKQERHVMGKFSIHNTPEYLTVLLVLLLTTSLSSAVNLNSPASLQNHPHHPSFRKLDIRVRSWRCPGYDRDITETDLVDIKEKIKHKYIEEGPSKLLVTGTPYSSQLSKGGRQLQWRYDINEKKTA
ncbi:hypothetical protein GcC1_063014 [Golovinomyces cichoracearum]|uniref:Uncharacterized protein n=1 Tax=Golovinomyces cichoracearum TaxID=62708 RepID=A0A420ISF5_9PEZI|nr:hypothetical protein GcC1_063014 [Golovinomyces cichoracearum]